MKLRNLFKKQIQFTKEISPNKKTYLSNIAWAISGKLVNIFCSLFVGILVARYLGPQSYGTMNYVVSFVSLFTILANFGLDNIEVKEFSRKCYEHNVIVGTCFYLQMIFAVATFLITIFIAIVYEDDWNSIAMIVVYSLSMILSPFNVIRNYFSSILQNKFVVKTEIWRNLLSAIIKIFLVVAHAPLFYFIVALTFDFIILASGYIYSYNKIGMKMSYWKLDINLSKYLLRTSFPLLLSGAAVIIYQKIDQVMIGNMIDKTSVGYFSTAGKFTELILYLPTIISTTLTPTLVKSYEENREQYIYKRQAFSNLIVWASIIIAIIVCILAYPMIIYTFGYDYLASVPILQVMAFKTVGNALASTSGTMLIIENKQKYAVSRNLIGMIFCVILNYILIPIYGILGSAIVTIITIFSSGYFAHILIPEYRDYFKLQTHTLLYGWKELPQIIKNLKR